MSADLTGVFRRPSKTRCPRATPTVRHRPAETRDPSVQKDRRAHTMATHRRMHMNQTVFGDTPHERGALGKLTVLLDSLGIIPACAGSTMGLQPAEPDRRDHPRMRGEHAKGMPEGLHTAGSSPHARGARRVHDASEALPGIIPACAGSTIGAFSALRMPRDHPRIRGEHDDVDFWEVAARGSSPHTRGALPLLSQCSVHAGIIPAYAGSTVTSSRTGTPSRDHPRMRGEHVREGEKPPENAGSSPPARGALLPPVTDSVGLGIIPAYAGSTRAG